jgi:hypothetical protein
MLQTALERRDRHSNLLSPELRRTRDQQFGKIGKFFQGVTHHQYAPTHEEFLSEVSGFESLILFYLTPVTASQQTEITGIIEQTPTPESESRLKELSVHNGANLLFFLTNVQDPQWLPFLKAIGSFRQLPEGENTDDGGKIYRSAPSLSCLARLASKAPEETLEILKNLPQSKNPQIPDQVMRCIAGIQNSSLIPECFKLLKKILKQPGQHDWIWIQEILKTWTALGNTTEVIDLIRAYLYSTIRRQGDRNGAGTGWQFNEIDQDFVAPLILSHPSEMANILFKSIQFWKRQQSDKIKLESNAIDTTTTTGLGDADSIGEKIYDPPTYWLEDFRNRRSHSYELEELLATRLYEIGNLIFAGSDQKLTEDYDTLLQTDSWELFHRLRWQLYAEYPTNTCLLAKEEILLKFPYLSYYRGFHGYEMAQMLEAHSQSHGSAFLSPDEVEAFYTNVMEGPINYEGEKETDEQDIKMFHRNQLHPIRSLLSGAARETYDKLVDEAMAPQMSSYKPFSSGGGTADFCKPPIF